MKFSIATLSLAFASAQAASFNLRSQQKAARPVVNNDRLLDSEVILKGTTGNPSAEDLEFIGKALVASYNDVHWEVGHYMTGSHAVDYKGPDSFLCNHCPDDDSMGGANANTNVFAVQTPVSTIRYSVSEKKTLEFVKRTNKFFNFVLLPFSVGWFLVQPLP